MRVDTATLPDACRLHVDRINQALAAGEYDQAFYLAYQYFRARVQNCHKRRPQDADGFRRQAAYSLAVLANGIHRGHPLDEFRFSALMIPGGDWEPRS
jgi:hypothetical protein